MTTGELVARWRSDAELLDRHGAAQAAATARLHAEQLEAVLVEHADQALTLTEAATESGFSADHLRHLVAGGTIPNAGRSGAPRIRRADLPRKARAADSGFDPRAHARDILGAGRS